MKGVDWGKFISVGQDNPSIHPLAITISFRSFPSFSSPLLCLNWIGSFGLAFMAIISSIIKHFLFRSLNVIGLSLVWNWRWKKKNCFLILIFDLRWKRHAIFHFWIYFIFFPLVFFNFPFHFTGQFVIFLPKRNARLRRRRLLLLFWHKCVKRCVCWYFKLNISNEEIWFNC